MGLDIFQDGITFSIIYVHTQNFTTDSYTLGLNIEHKIYFGTVYGRIP